MNENLISWTPQNVITVFLMALLGWVVVSFLIVAAKSRQKKSGASYGANTAQAPAGAM